MKYRKDIDGLRALAVIPVLIYHAELGVFHGGFLGVDIFFVISGFLITAILLEEMTEKRFTFSGFYERRVRRLLPALIVVLAVTSILSYWFMTTVDLKSYGSSLIAVSFFSSNIFFWMESGYFDTAAELKPILHTWSLAVEEQYYFVFPAILLVVLRFFPKLLLHTVVIFLITSLLLSNWGASQAPDANFYLLPTRAWELMFGSIASITLFHSRDNTVKFPFAAKLKDISFLVVVVYLSCFDSTNLHPSFATLVPVLATAFLLVIRDDKSLSQKLLSMKYVVLIGSISYSLYLWHQPLLVFHKYTSTNDSAMIRSFILIIALIIAYLSWRFVEAPFRNKNKVSKRTVYVLCSSSFTLLILFGVLAHHSGFPSRYTESEVEVMSYLDYDKNPASKNGYSNCFLEQNQSPDEYSAECFMNGKGVLIWGDSHASALVSGVEQQAEGGLNVLTSSACLPIINTMFQHRKKCEESNSFILEKAKTLNYSVVLLHGNWISHKDKIDRLADTLRALEEIDTKIFVIGGVPQFHPNLPSLMISKSIQLDAVGANTRVKSTHYEEIKAIDEKLLTITTQFRNVTFISALKGLCSNEGACTVVTPSSGKKDAWVPIIWDYGHLTREGSQALAELIPIQKATEPSANAN